MNRGVQSGHVLFVLYHTCGGGPLLLVCYLGREINAPYLFVELLKRVATRAATTTRETTTLIDTDTLVILLCFFNALWR
jgi:hypothetical protein